MDIVSIPSFPKFDYISTYLRIDEESESRTGMGKVCVRDIAAAHLLIYCGTDSFGPDPYLNGEGAFETITGVQSVGVMACAKHLVANNQEHWRYGLSANVDERTLQEIYWYPFLRSIEVCLHVAVLSLLVLMSTRLALRP